MHLRKAGQKLQRFFVMRDRLVELAEADERIAEVIVRFGVGGLEAQGLFILLDRGVGLAFGIESETEICQRDVCACARKPRTKRSKAAATLETSRRYRQVRSNSDAPQTSAR